MTDDRRSLAALLLLLQGGLALLAAVGLVVLARLSNAFGAIAVPAAIAFGGPAVLLVLAIGISRGWRWATFGIPAWEAVTLLGTAFSILTSGGSSLTLTVGLTGLVLPAAIVLLAVRPNASGNALRKGLTVGLLLVTGFVHIALVPEHLRQAPGLGVLFALDGAAFIILALASLRFGWWRRPTTVLLVATILAYLVVIIRQREAVEDLAVATKLVELAALGLVVWPFDQRLSWRWATATVSLLLAITVSGAVAWAASLRPDAVGHAHDGRAVLAAAPPTDSQRIAAATLVDDTRAGIERYANVQVALDDGYRATTPLGPMQHYVNQEFQRSGRVLDPTHPPALVYTSTPSGPMLLGAMYMMPKANMRPPDFGGSLAEWHTHPNVCFMLPTFTLDSLESPFGTCPVGSINAPTPAMLHVWTVANPGGPFAEELSPAFIARLSHGSVSS
jgi:hypothetical protein